MRYIRAYIFVLASLVIGLAPIVEAVAQIPGGIGTKVYPPKPNRTADPVVQPSGHVGGVMQKLHSLQGTASRTAMAARKLNAGTLPADPQGKAALVHYTEEMGTRIREQARALAVAKSELVQLERQNYADEQQKALGTLNRLAEDIRRDLESSASDVRTTLARLRPSRTGG